MLVAVYTKGNTVHKSVLFDNELDNFDNWCKQYKPKKVWILDTDLNKIIRAFTVETEVSIKDI